MSQVPEFRWAENDKELWVTIEINNAKDVDVKITSDEVVAKATAGEKKYELQFKTKKTLNNEKSSFAVRDRGIELKLIKSDSDSGFWNHLLADSHKNALKQRCKIDWDLWKDEDEEDEKKPSAGFGEGGFPGMGGMGGMMGGMGGMDGMMGGMPGMGGMGGMPGGFDMSQLGGMGDDFDAGAGGDSDDDDLPDLEEAPKDGGKKEDESETKDTPADKQ